MAIDGDTPEGVPGAFLEFGSDEFQGPAIKTAQVCLRVFRQVLLGDVEHALVIGLHHAMREGRQQDVVRLLPVGLLRLGGEQRIAAQHAHPAQRAAHRLVEALLVAQLGHQVGARDDDQRCAHHVEPEDRALLARDAHEVLDRRAAVDREHVAQHRRARRMRNRMQLVARHGMAVLPVLPRYCLATPQRESRVGMRARTPVSQSLGIRV